MASYTEHCGLHQWEPDDNFLRTDFNTDFNKIDQNIGELRSSALLTSNGSYVGTGTYDSNNPNRLDFDFKPKIVMIAADSVSIMKIGTIFFAGQTESHGIGVTTMSNAGLDITLSWTETGISWYSDSAESQLNQAGITYFYFALG